MMMSNSIFDKYLNSVDASTLELEIAPLVSFQTLYEMMQEVDSNDSQVLAKLVQLQHGDTDKLEPIEESQRTLFDLIRNVWDIAYSYGAHDALADSNVSLMDMED